MRYRVLSFLLLTGVPAAASGAGARLETACYTEISFFCSQVPEKAGPWLKCLREHADAATMRCKEAMKAAAEALAPKPAPVPSGPASAAPGAPQAAKPSAPASAETDVRLTRVEGTVYLRLAGQPEELFIKAASGTPLDSGDLVRTGTDGKAELAMNADSVVELAGGSDLSIGRLDAEKVEWRLSIGSLVAKIRSLAAGRKMEFATPTAVAAIRGTELWVRQEESGQPAGFGVFDEGRLAVTSLAGGKEVVLGPNQQTEVAPGGPPAPPKPLSVKPQARALIEQARRRADEVKKDWKPEDRRSRNALRRQFAGKNAIAADKLTNLREAQKRAGPGASKAAKPSPAGPGVEPHKPAGAAAPARPGAAPAKAVKPPAKAAEPVKQNRAVPKNEGDKKLSPPNRGR